VTESLLLTIPEAAQQLACSTRLVEKLISSGDLQSVRLGKRARRVPRTDLLDYIGRLRGEQDDLIDGAISRHAKAEGGTLRRSQKEVKHRVSPTALASRR
jgi:excisionase family DNA binding protein